MSAIPVEDRLDLQELVARYAFRCDTKLYSEIQHLFTDDGIFDETVIGLPLCTGRPAIHELFNNVGPAVDYLIHLNCNHQKPVLWALRPIGRSAARSGVRRP
jgi:hypothetical protein